MTRRGEIQLTPDEQAAFLREPHKAALATVDKDGFPHVVAMGFLAKDGVIYMTSYAKAQKVLNVRRNPKVAVMIEAGRGQAGCRITSLRGGRGPPVPQASHRIVGTSALSSSRATILGCPGRGIE